MQFDQSENLARWADLQGGAKVLLVAVGLECHSGVHGGGPLPNVAQDTKEAKRIWHESPDQSVDDEVIFDLEY